MTRSASVYKYCKEEHNFCHKIHLHNRRAKIIRVQEDTTSCPLCKKPTRYDEHHNETYCSSCGLVVSAPIEYVGLKRIHYPYGKK